MIVTLLTTASFDAEAKSISISGTDVYVTGHEFTNDAIIVPWVWKNETWFLLQPVLMKGMPIQFLYNKLFLNIEERMLSGIRSYFYYQFIKSAILNVIKLNYFN